MKNNNAIIEAINLGSNYLRKQLLSGNYGLSCVGKNGSPKFSNNKGHLFSVFHIVQALKEDINEIERTIFLMRILSEENNGQWGYSPRGYYKETEYNPFFVDSDDTAFALRTLRALDIYRSNDIFLKYVAACKNNGEKFDAFTTFINQNQERQLVSVANFENNLQIHPEVNANIYHSLLDTHNDYLINHKLISSSQQKDGSWNSFFYPNPYYSTFQFMSLIHKINNLKTCFDKGITYLTQNQNNSGSWSEKNDAYYTATALKTLCLQKKHNEVINKGILFLLNNIDADGAWKSSQPVWRFYDNEGDTWTSFDVNHVITTSVCVEALKDFLIKDEL